MSQLEVVLLQCGSEPLTAVGQVASDRGQLDDQLTDEQRNFSPSAETCHGGGGGDHLSGQTFPKTDYSFSRVRACVRTRQCGVQIKANSLQQEFVTLLL
jgi:hypothetical protein